MPAGCALRSSRRPGLACLIGLVTAAGLLPHGPALAAEAANPAGSARIAFTLARDAVTSAGVFTEDGRLLRTLWRAQPLAKGEHVRAWDRRDDAGQVVPDASAIRVSVLHHRITAVWEGVVGNSSDTFVGAQVHRAFSPPTSIVVVGSQAVYAAGYNEGQPGLHGFALSAPGLNTRPVPAPVDPFVSYTLLAADGARLYWANTGGLSKSSFVGAFALPGGARAPFAGGSEICLNHRPNSPDCYPSQFYAGVIDLGTEPADAATGLAVQRNGKVLAVAHGGRGVVRLFDKRSGQALGEIALPLQPAATNQLAMSPGGALWVISGRSVLRFEGLEGKPRQTLRIDGLDQPLAVATAPGDGDELWVADGGSSQQLKRFDAQGRAGDVIGRAGGLRDEPELRQDALCFGVGTMPSQTALAITDAGAVWVVDTCHNRMLRWRREHGGNWTRDAQLAYLPASYLAAVDAGQPRRVFANFLEFEIDGAAPLQPGDRSWRLRRNWLAGLPKSLQDANSGNRGFGGLAVVQTLANGRTYGLMTAHERQVLVELPAAGPLRLVRTFAAPPAGTTARVLYENGELGYSLTGPSTQAVLRLPLRGFDAAGDPVWSGDPVLLARVPLQPGSPHYRGAFSGVQAPRFPLTGAGRVVFFDGSVQGNEGFHLGAAASGSRDWLWQASPTAALDGLGSFQTRRIDGSLQYGGNVVMAVGRHIVYGYHGEFYRDLMNGRVGQANQFMHFDESGLFIGQFGLPSTRASEPAQAGLSGNALSPQLLRDGERLFVYHNDESSHGGVHRWRLDGWNDVQVLRASLQPDR